MDRCSLLLEWTLLNGNIELAEAGAGDRRLGKPKSSAERLLNLLSGVTAYVTAGFPESKDMAICPGSGRDHGSIGGFRTATSCYIG